MTRVTKKGGGTKKRRSRKLSKQGRHFWLILSLVVFSLVNVLFLDTLIGLRFGWHFLPRPVYMPFYSFFSPKVPEKPQGPYIPPPPPLKKEKAKAKEEKPEPPPKAVKRPEVVTPAKTRPLEEKEGPKVALVIDDLGYNLDLANELLRIGVPFSVSILPNLPYTEITAKRAMEKGKEVLLHLPMEPYDYPNTQVEKGTLLTTMEDGEIRMIIAEALEDLGCAIGANNHMGSRMVENAEKMRVILEEMKERGLFFLDSRTSPRSVVYDLAKDMGVKTAKRDVFLDGKNDIPYIHKQLEQLADIAMNNGCAIGIGHLQPKTIEALRMYLPELEKRGIRFVKASEVTE